MRSRRQLHRNLELAESVNRALLQRNVVLRGEKEALEGDLAVALLRAELAHRTQDLITRPGGGAGA